MRASFFMVAAAGLAFAVLSLWSRQASAYPQFQFSSGTQSCAQCHYSPAGYGLLTSWGRDESGDTISMGGDGAFLHGAVTPPRWLAAGGDFRLAFLRNDSGGNARPELAGFPMQAELYGRAAFGDSGVSLYVAAGLRGATRANETGALIHSTEMISREHYLMWKPSATGAYVRAGRFYAPYGLRMAEHIYYVRRYTGFNLYEETYNLSGGYLDEGWEVHATAFTPPPSGFPRLVQSSGMRGSGGAVYAEKRLASMAAIGLQGRVSVNADRRMFQGGALGKLWIDAAKLLIMGEVDLHRIDGSTSVLAHNQMVGYFGLTFFPIKGIMAGVAVERYQEDLRLARTGRNAFDLQVHIFPLAHCEIMMLGRYQMTGAGAADGDSATLGLLQLHYYL